MTSGAPELYYCLTYTINMNDCFAGYNISQSFYPKDGDESFSVCLVRSEALREHNSYSHT